MPPAIDDSLNFSNMNIRFGWGGSAITFSPTSSKIGSAGFSGAATQMVNVSGTLTDNTSKLQVKWYPLGDETNAETKVVAGNGMAANIFSCSKLDQIQVMELRVVSNSGKTGPVYKAYVFNTGLETQLEKLTNIRVIPQMPSGQSVEGHNGALIFSDEQMTYHTTVYGTDKIKISPTAVDKDAAITVNGTAVASNQTSDVIDLGQDTTAIEVKLGDKTYTVNVEKAPLNSIKITKAPTTIEYVEGETFSKAGMKVAGVFGTEEKTVTGFTATAEPLAAGTNKVDMTWGGKSTEQSITVISTEAKAEAILAAVRAAGSDDLEAIITANYTYIGLDADVNDNYQYLRDKAAVNNEIAGKEFASLEALKTAFMKAYEEELAEEDLQDEVNSYVENYAVRQIAGMCDDLEGKLTVDNCASYTYNLTQTIPRAYERLSKEAKLHVRKTKDMMDQATAHYYKMMDKRNGIVSLAKDSLKKGESLLEQTEIAADGSTLDDSVYWVTEKNANAFGSKIETFKTDIANVGTSRMPYSALSDSTDDFDMVVSSFNNLRKPGSVKVAEVQAAAIESLNNAYDPSKYSASDQKYIEMIIDTAKKEIGKAETSGQVASALGAALEKIQGVEVLDQEEKALEQAKSAALTAVNAYGADLSKYRAAEQLQVLTYIISAQSRIDTAKTTAEVRKVLDEINASVAALKTDATYKTEAMRGAAIVLTVKAETHNAARLTWTRTAEAEGYEVYRAADQGGPFTRITTTAGADYRDANQLATGKTYHYKVRAFVKADDKTVFSKDSNAASVKITLAAPSKLKAKADKKKAALSWKKVSGADGYKVYRATKAKGTYKAVKTINRSYTVKFTNKKLKKGKTYYFKVKAYKKVNGKKVYSGYSKTVKVKAK